MQFVNCYLIEKQQRILDEGHKVLENAANVILARHGREGHRLEFNHFYRSFKDF